MTNSYDDGWTMALIQSLNDAIIIESDVPSVSQGQSVPPFVFEAYSSYTESPSSVALSVIAIYSASAATPDTFLEPPLEEILPACNL